MPVYFEMIEWSGVVYREYSKGLKLLPCGMPNSNRTDCDYELEATTVLKALVRNDDNDERADEVIPNQCF